MMKHKVTITLQDEDNGELSTRFHFEPEVDEDNLPESSAVRAALCLLEMIAEHLKSLSDRSFQSANNSALVS